jgi:hypothetical protein
MGPRRWVRHLWAIAGYAVVGVGFAWPLPARLATHLTGPPSGDTGVYVWNLWVFHHEIVHHHAFPYLTSTIFSLDPQADLSLHNYTIFANVLGLPLLSQVGVVATFNLLYILLTIVTAYAMFLLAREVTKSDAAAWLAGVLFAFSPTLVARGTAHFSLVEAAPLPIFAWLLLRAERSGSRLLGAALGATAAWAALCDVYYGVYCLMLALFHLAARTLRLELRWRDGPGSRWAHVLTGLIGIVAGVVGWVAVTGGGRFDLLGRTVTVQGLHNPVLALCLLALVRLALATRPRLRVTVPPEIWRLIALIPYGTIAGLAILSPWLYTLAARAIEGRFVAYRVFWRSSPAGVDALAFFMPNPSHPLYGALWQGWLTARPGGFAENVAGIPLIVFLVVGFAMWRTGTWLSRYWVSLTLAFGALALGPFVVVGGMNTYVPTPWALLRYLPVIGAARTPARFSVVMMMGVAVLAALAIQRILEWSPGRRRLALGALGGVLMFELLPAPRVLYSAVPPAIYQRIASDPRDVRVLELPFGIRDGLSSAGNFSAASQFYQTFHHKSLIGGYLSRVSPRRVTRARSMPTRRALLILSEGRQLTPKEMAEVEPRARTFLSRSRIGYVVIDRSRAAPALVSFALQMFDLEKIGEAGSRELYRPRNAVRAAR